MSLLMLVGIITTLLSSEPREHKFKLNNSENLISAVFWAPIREISFQDIKKCFFNFFIGVYRLSDLSMAVMANPFYLDIGFTPQIASVTKVLYRDDTDWSICWRYYCFKIWSSSYLFLRSDNDSISLT